MDAELVAKEWDEARELVTNRKLFTHKETKKQYVIDGANRVVGHNEQPKVVVIIAEAGLLNPHKTKWTLKQFKREFEEFNAKTQ